MRCTAAEAYPPPDLSVVVPLFNEEENVAELQSQITGALLVFALLVMPAAAAQQLTARPILGLGLAMGFGLFVVWAALSFAFYSPWPVGFFVTTFGFALYLGAAGFRWAAARWPRGAREVDRSSQARSGELGAAVGA